MATLNTFVYCFSVVSLINSCICSCDLSHRLFIVRGNFNTVRCSSSTGVCWGFVSTVDLHGDTVFYFQYPFYQPVARDTGNYQPLIICQGLTPNKHWQIYPAFITFKNKLKGGLEPFVDVCSNLWLLISSKYLLTVFKQQWDENLQC